jgi:hypothetical protein
VLNTKTNWSTDHRSQNRPQPVEADKVAREFTTSISSAYRLSTSKVRFSEPNDDLPGLDWLLKHKKRLRKLWQETRDQMCKEDFNWIDPQKALEQWNQK